MTIRTGPVTKDAKTVALGLAKILIGSSSAHIDKTSHVLQDPADSLGALNSSSFTSNVEYWKLLSGFPQLEDTTVPLSETATLECEFKEIHAKNLAIARGLDPSSGGSPSYSDVPGDGDEIPLGTLKSPEYVRAEAIYTYPNGTNHMYIIFPRAQVTSSMELSFAAEDNVNVAVTIESKQVSSDLDDVDTSVWNESPLGRIYFD